MAIKLAGIFPGQGSEHDAMSGPIMECPAFDDVFGKINRAANTDVLSDLSKPLNAHLAMFGASVCWWRMLKDVYKFDALAGHSLGFYAAAYAAGAVALDDGITMTIEAERAISDMAKGGEWSMAVVIGLKAEIVEGLCSECGDARVSNINSATQIVVSGRKQAVESLISMAMAKGALDVKPMNIEYPLHSVFMAGIKDRLTPVVKKFRIKEPLISVFDHTAAARPLNAAGIAEVLSGQLERRVLWRDTVANMDAEGFIEVGPGSVLTKLVRWIKRDATAMTSEEALCKTGSRS